MLARPEVICRPQHASAALEAWYRKKLKCLIREMHCSVIWWLRAAYRADTPVLAQDASPAHALSAAIRKLVRRWQKRFNAAAPQLARYFATDIMQRSDKHLHKILKDSGFTVEFKMTPAMRDVFAATVRENVSLIRSIPQQHFAKIEGLVMRSVQTGRDLQQLTKDLQKNFAVTRRRAELIARDQNNKATGALQRARQIGLGMAEAIWIHSGGGRHPRPAHVRMSGKRYKLSQGMWDSTEKRYVFPGELIECKCTSRPVIPGM